MEYGYLQNITWKTKFLNFFRSIFFIPFLEKMLVEINAGKPNGSLISKFIPNHYQYKKGTYRTVERQGIYYKLDLSELMDWWIFFGFKDDSKEKILSRIEKGNTVIDVGANLGLMSFSFAKKVGKKGQVISFEPDPINYTRFLENSKLNSFSNVKLVKKGLGDQNGKFRIATNKNEPGNNGSNSIIPTNNNEHKNVESREIEVTSLDNWIPNQQISKIDLLKVDIEGFEMQALKGALNTLKTYRPKIYIELHDAKLKQHGSSAKQLVGFLQELNYHLIPDEKINLSGSLVDVHTDLTCISNN